MPYQPSSFEVVLEADMQALAAEIKNQREKPELRNAAEKEILKEAIRAFPVLEKKPQAGASAATSPTNNADTGKSPLPAYAQSAPAEVKLEIDYLLDITLRKGLSQALSEAKGSSYFVQDTFHDALAGRFYPELQKRGIVK